MVNVCSQKQTNIGNDKYDSQLVAVITNKREGRKERNNDIYDYNMAKTNKSRHRANCAALIGRDERPKARGSMNSVIDFARHIVQKFGVLPGVGAG